MQSKIDIFYSSNSILKQSFLLLFACFGLSLSIGQVSNDGQIIPKGQQIRFSTILNEKQESLEPYYAALKQAKFGIQRFSIFEQLATHHISTANTDSIMYYGELYLKEIRNWDETKVKKNIHLTKAHYIIAQGCKFNGLFDNALKWHIKGITNAEVIKDTAYQYLHKISLGKIYNLKNESNKAIAVLEPAIEDFGSLQPNETNEALTYLGDAYYAQQSYDKANAALEKALKGCKAAGNLEMELNINLKLGLLAERQNEPEQALSFYNESRNRGLQEGFYAIYFEGTIRIGTLFYKEGHYEAANAALSIAYINAVDRENLHYQAEILSVQHKVFSATEDYSNAYAVMTQLSNIKAKINTTQQKKVSKELEIQYETLQKEKEILTLTEKQIQKESELQRQKIFKYAFLIGFLVILIPIMALLYTYYQKIQAQSELSKKQDEINAQQVAALEQEQELNLIKASIEGQDEERKRIAQELHDSIGGNLAGIKLQLASAEKPEEIDSIGRQLDETYQLVRDISHTLVPKKFKENAFTELITEYINSISKTGKLAIGFHPYPEKLVNGIDEKLQMEFFKIIQELMTNTLKHSQAKNVELHLTFLDEEISLLFEDNGKGFDTNETSKGIGSLNIIDRVKQMQGRLNIDSQIGRGTVISIEVPLKQKST